MIGDRAMKADRRLREIEFEPTGRNPIQSEGNRCTPDCAYGMRIR